MKFAITGLAVSLLAMLGGIAWLFRYDYLPPVVWSEIPTRENPTGKKLVVCKADRWSRSVTCASEIVDIEQIVRDVERWAREHEESKKREEQKK